MPSCLHLPLLQTSQRLEPFTPNEKLVTFSSLVPFPPICASCIIDFWWLVVLSKI